VVVGVQQLTDDVVVVVVQLPELWMFSLRFVEAFDVRAGKAMRLNVTTAKTDKAARELVSNRAAVTRHSSTSSRKVSVCPSLRIKRTFFFILENPFRPCGSQK
jgi:hypothetical protein